ncbi:TonB-dependent receptor [Spirochaetia bacterium]|nr:TonB-dependent receptor [Spirochaetia bacterium]
MYGQDKAVNDDTDDESLPVLTDDTGLTVDGIIPQPPTMPVSTPYGPHNEVSAQEIHEQGALDFLDALNEVPGLMTSSPGMLGSTTGSNLFIRGRGSSHPSLDTVTYFDGVPRYGLIYGQSMADSIPLNAVRGVDVFKGPQPSSFGAGYGLVNVRPEYQETQGWQAKAGVTGGSWKTLAENVAFGLRRGRFDIYASQSWTGTGGHVVHSNADQQSYYVNGGIWINAFWDLRVLFNYVHAKTEQPPKIGQSKKDILSTFTTDSIFSTVTANNTYDKAEGFVKVYINNNDFKWLDDEPRIAGDWSAQKLFAVGAKLKETLRLFSGNELIAGVDFDYIKASNEDHNTRSESVTSIYPDLVLVSPYAAMSHYFELFKRLRIIPQAGVRGYIHTVWPSRIAPQAGIVIGYKDIEANFNYSLGIIYPAPGLIQNLAARNSVNIDALRDVRPETVYHYEAGIAYNKKGFFSVGASWFYDDGRNRIISMGSSPVPQNATTAAYFRIGGIEWNTSLNIEKGIPLLERLSLFAGGTWLYNIEAKGENDFIMTRLPYTPFFSATFGVKWTLLKTLTLRADYKTLLGLYGGSLDRGASFTQLNEINKLDDQHIINLRVSYQFKLKKIYLDEAEIFASFNNILNYEYEYYAGYKMPGFTFMIGCQLKFK